MCYRVVGSVAMVAILVASFAVLLIPSLQKHLLPTVERFFDRMEYIEKHFRLPEPRNGTEISLLMVGAAGNGRSALGNYIIGRSAFDSRYSARMVTRENKLVRTEIGPRKLLVVDTPGLLGYQDMVEIEEVVESLKSIFTKSPTGYSAFLVVMNQATRITRDQIDAIKILEVVFGYAFFKHAIFVFTHKDLFESSFDSGYDLKEEFTSFIDNLPDDMADFFERADDRVMFVNSLDARRVINRDFQVELINMVDSMTRGNKYTKQSFDNAQEVLKEEIQEKLKMEDLEKQERERVIWDKALATCECKSHDSEYQFKFNFRFPGSEYVEYYLSLALNTIIDGSKAVVDWLSKMITYNH